MEKCELRKHSASNVKADTYIKLYYYYYYYYYY